MIGRKLQGRRENFVGKRRTPTNSNLTGEGNDGGLLFQFYAPRYCLRQARVSNGDSQNRTSSVCLRQTLCLKENQKGQSLNLVA